MFHVTVDRTTGRPMYLQIYEYIVNEIKRGNLHCNDKLPSGRELAMDLNISRNTINMAYEQLEAEGYIEAYPKKGYYVRALDGLLEVTVSGENEKEIEVASRKEEYKIDFSPFGIDARYAPYLRWQKLMKETMLDEGGALFQNGDNQGESALRESIREYLHRARGVTCRENQIIIGAGTDYLLMLLTRLLPGKPRIAMENPVYQQAYRVFRNFQYSIDPIGIDADGLDVQELQETEAQLVFVTPSHQFPLGVVMPINRRLQLLNWAYEQDGRYIIEDDYDSEFRYQGRPIPALQGLDTKGKVIYMGTFSKAIAPSIRIGYMVLPNDLCERYRKEAAFYATTVSRLEQEVVHRFIEEGYFERHMNRMRGIYKEKHDRLIQALSQWSLPIRWRGDSAGLHLLIEFPESSGTEQQFVQRAEQQGIRVYALSDYYIQGEPEVPTLLLGYARLTEEEIVEGACLLEKAWKEMH